jgi:hypothetical protein
MNELLCDSLWSTIKRLAKRATTKRAAVAYITSDEFVKFADGDVLITDASEPAIASGQTNAKVLARAFKRGAELYSLRGLLSAADSASITLDLLRPDAQVLRDLQERGSVRLARLAALDAGDRLGRNRAKVALPQALHHPQSAETSPKRLVFLAAPEVDTAPIVRVHLVENGVTGSLVITQTHRLAAVQ